jgi:hypothetical protein
VRPSFSATPSHLRTFSISPSAVPVWAGPCWRRCRSCRSRPMIGRPASSRIASATARNATGFRPAITWPRGRNGTRSSEQRLQPNCSDAVLSPNRCTQSLTAWSSITIGTPFRFTTKRVAFTGEGKLVRKATGYEQEKLKPRYPTSGSRAARAELAAPIGAYR